MSGHGTSFFESKTWKNIMKYTYGLGAAVVIMGALFKNWRIWILNGQ